MHVKWFLAKTTLVNYQGIFQWITIEQEENAIEHNSLLGQIFNTNMIDMII